MVQNIWSGKHGPELRVNSLLYLPCASTKCLGDVTSRSAFVENSLATCKGLRILTGFPRLQVCGGSTKITHWN
jgi:hypothetical protein